ncbi:MAG: hypothetical protein IT258_01875, partial [Saprospiraceae bacterium]|nr:hypothetical protein [Saprospiraceae bacterium]
DNTEGNYKYEVKAKEDIVTKYGALKNCWKIESEATFPFGVSKLVFWFHEEYGFVKMQYLNYGGQTLVFELTQVTENE